MDWRPRHDPWAITLVVTMATFMEILDTSIANVALPHIAGNLSVTVDEGTWVLTSYLVSNAVVLPLSGWLSTRFGRKRFYMSCVAVFTVSSFLCGIAPDLSTLILCRVLQGAGGGGLQPSEQAIIADTFPREKWGVAFSVYGMAVVLAPAIGPTLGGYITDHSSWRWIFFINVPVGIASLVLTQRFVEDPPWLTGKSGIKVDYIGFALVAVGFGALQIVLDKGEREDWFSSTFIVVFAGLAAVGILGAAVWEWFEEHPVVDVRLFRQRNLAVCFVLILVFGAILYSSTVLLPQYVQTVMGYSAEQAGMVLSPGGVVVLVLMPLVGRLLGTVDVRKLIAFGFLVCALALYDMTNIYRGVSFGTAVWYRMFQAAGLAFLFVPLNTAAYVGIPQEKNNQVAGLANLARNIGGSVGISLAQTALSRRAQFHQTHLVSHVTPYDPALRRFANGLAQSLAQRGVAAVEASRRAYAIIYGIVQREAVSLAFIDAIWILAIASLVVIPLVLLMKRPPPGASMAMH
jgi:DHA2 family multidrug resistance protein